ncbi:hypothetical protein HGRIS_005831 [Hohenbuehelia grisea]|uniref:HPt domain-containing protein n=1 Tax=Hohenbuehelia grisea TaxID=104357 RepID=A0ABR3K0B3_9AGAR
MSLSLAESDRSHPLQSSPTDNLTNRHKSPSPAPAVPSSNVSQPVNNNRTSPSPPSPRHAPAVVPDEPEPKPEPRAENELGVPEDIIDMEIFRQILDLDDDETEFSREMTMAYITQAAETFKKMDKSLATKDLADLSHLGHYLKGSSAAIGIYHVQAACEKIQHLGQLRDEEKAVDVTPDVALKQITELIQVAKEQNTVAEAWLREYYKITAEEAP